MTQPYEVRKTYLQSLLQKKEITSLREGVVAGVPALISENIRNDYPGNYQQTMFLQKSGKTITIIRSVHADNSLQEEKNRQETDNDFQQVLSSFIVY